MVMLNVTTSPKTQGNSYYGLAIGFTMCAAAFAGGSISGGAFNPAVGFGTIVVDAINNKESHGFGNLWIYFVGPLLGGFIAAFVYRYQNELAQPASAEN
jgi:aquaporin Z